MSINKVVISGNLTRDPEVRQTASGMPVLSFGIAVNDSRKNAQTGEWENYANFIDCTWFGTRAEKCAQYMYKGQKVAIEGKLRWSQWEKNGDKRSKLEVIVEEIELMSRSNASEQPQTSQQANYTAQPQTQAYNAPQVAQNGYYQQPQPPQYNQQQMDYSAPVYDTSVYDEDIPF